MSDTWQDIGHPARAPGRCADLRHREVRVCRRATPCRRPAASTCTVSTPAHHSGNRVGSNSSFHTSSTGARAPARQRESRACRPPARASSAARRTRRSSHVGLDEPDDRRAAEVDQRRHVLLAGRAGRAAAAAPALRRLGRAAAGPRRSSPRARATRPCTRAIRGTSAHGWSARRTGSSAARRSSAAAAPRPPRTASASAIASRAAGVLTAASPSSAAREQVGGLAVPAGGERDEPGVVPGEGEQRRRVEPLGGRQQLGGRPAASSCRPSRDSRCARAARQGSVTTGTSRVAAIPRSAVRSAPSRSPCAGQRAGGHRSRRRRRGRAAATCSMAPPRRAAPTASHSANRPSRISDDQPGGLRFGDRSSASRLRHAASATGSAPPRAGFGLDRVARGRLVPGQAEQHLGAQRGGRVRAAAAPRRGGRRRARRTGCTRPS